MHKTSLNVSMKMNGQLDKISDEFRISKKRLVARIFRYCHENLDFSILVTGKLSGYQKKCPGDKWKCLRVDFSDTECDVYFEYRKIFRISLSKLLAIGFFLFFDQIVAELSGDSDEKKETIKQILYNYTEIKRLLYKSIQDSLKFFNLPQEKEP